MKRQLLRFVIAIGLVLGTLASQVPSAQALDRLCDPGGEDCRAILINYIRAEQVGIDVGFWFMEDARYTTELIRRYNAGVRVRVLMDPRANASYVLNAARVAELQTAGIPMRKRTANGILHYKMMLFTGQNVVEFSGANFSADAFNFSGAPYSDYTDESIYFTDDLAIVNSFRTKFDDLWTNTTSYADYANILGPLLRVYDLFPRAPELNFPPGESYATRAVGRYNKETQKIDVVMYRITDRRHTDAIIAARGRGIPVRLITEPKQYRDPTRLWHSWNVDRLYMAGVQIKQRAHAGLNHQKSVLLYGQGTTIFGSSNWTSPSANSQEEHNYFTTKPTIFQWFVDQFERKWNNTGGVVENTDFVPLPPRQARLSDASEHRAGCGPEHSCAEVVRRAICSQVRRLPGHGSEQSPARPDRYGARAEPVTDRLPDVHARHHLEPGHPVLLARGLTDDGERVPHGRFVELHDRRHHAAAPPDRQHGRGRHRPPRTERPDHGKRLVDRVGCLRCGGPAAVEHERRGFESLHRSRGAGDLRRVHLQRRRRAALPSLAAWQG